MSVYKKHGIIIRILYLIWSMTGYFLTIGCWLGCKKTVVLCYHGVVPAHREYFRRQILQVNSQRLGVNKSSKTKSSGAFRLPEVYITFDDAFANLLDFALPLLNELCIPASIFAVPGNCGQTPKWNISREHAEYNETLMTAQQLQNIQSDLITIGSHTQTHSDLSKLLPDQVRWELVESKKNLEKILGKPVEDLALPHGTYNDNVLRIAQEVGYKRIFTLEPRPSTSLESGAIGRFSMSPDVWPIEFYLTCVGAYAWLFPFRRLLKKVLRRTAR